MSMITHYKMQILKNDLKTLLNKNILLKNNDLGCGTATHLLDLEKADHDLWAEETAHMRDRKIYNAIKPTVENIMSGKITIAHEAGALPDRIKELMAQGYKLRCNYFDYKSKKYTARMINCESEEKLVEYPEDAVTKIKAYAEKIVNMYIKDPDNKGYHRDYTEEELAINKLCPITVNEDESENTVWYLANYATDADNMIPVYISKALPSVVIPMTVTTEADLDYTGEIVNGVYGKNTCINK